VAEPLTTGQARDGSGNPHGSRSRGDHDPRILPGRPL